MSHTIRAALGPEPTATTAQWRLHVVVSPDPLSARRTLELPPGRVLIGRSAGTGPAAITIEDQRLSRQHVALRVDAGSGDLEVEVEDLQSSNGTWLRGKRITRQRIAHGGVLRIGNTVLVLEFDSGRAPAFIGSIPGVPGRSEIARSLREQVSGLARTTETILVCGPPGSGRRKLAREIHRQSGRRGSKAALCMDEFAPDEALDLLFGDEGDDPGLLSRARGGTFIAEAIDRTPAEVQRALRPVLTDPERLADLEIRVVATADSPPDEAAAAGSFDPELARALGRNLIALPGLSARRPDLIDLADRIVPLTGRRHADSWATVLDADCAEMFLHHEWSDNLSGLRRVLEPLIGTMGAHRCTVESLPPDLVRSVRERLHGRSHAARSTTTAVRRPRYTPLQLCHLLAVHGGVEAMAAGLGHSRAEVMKWFREAGE